MGRRAELVHTPAEDRPYKIVFWRDDQRLAEIPVHSVDAAIAVAENLIATIRKADGPGR
jgi:hypothetical protein